MAWTSNYSGPCRESFCFPKSRYNRKRSEHTHLAGLRIPAVPAHSRANYHKGVGSKECGVAPLKMSGGRNHLAKLLNQDGSFWWNHVLVLPLEIIPMDSSEQWQKKLQGKHSREWIHEFRIRANVREQAWISLLQTMWPKGLNERGESYDADVKTQRRRMRRKTTAKKNNERQNRQQNKEKHTPMEITIAPPLRVTDSGSKAQIRTENGPNRRIRQSINRILTAREAGEDISSILLQYSLKYRKKLLSWVISKMEA